MGIKLSERYEQTTKHEEGRASWYDGQTYFEVTPKMGASRDIKPVEDEQEELIRLMIEWGGYIEVRRT